MRKPIFWLLVFSTLFLCSCGDLVLFNQKIEGRDPVFLEGKYILEIEVEDQVLYDTLDFHRVLPYQFIAYSSLVKQDSQDYKPGHPHRRGEIFQGEIHQKGNDFFIQKKDKESGKWEIGAFRIKNGMASFLFEALYADEYHEVLVNLVKAGKLKVQHESERIYSEDGGSEDSKFTVYEVSSSEKQSIRMWRRILRKSDRLPIRKIEEKAALEGIDKTVVSAISSSLLYPNPSSGMVNLSLRTDSEWQAGLYDLHGKKLREVSFRGSTYVWNLSNMAAGTYFIKVNDVRGGESKTFKMVKK